MSRRDDIILRAQAEYQDAIQRRDALREALLAQQREELLRLPDSKKAVGAYEAALASAFEAYQLRLAKLEAEVLTTEADAIAVQDQQETAAIDAWRAADEAADVRRRDALDAAEAAHTEAFNAAMLLVGTLRDKAVAAARAKHEKASRDAHDRYLRDTNASFAAYQEASNAARERAIARIEKVRLNQTTGGEKAAETLRFDQEKAATVFRATLNALPAALAIFDAFQARLADCEARCEREKADVIARMNRDLENVA